MKLQAIVGILLVLALVAGCSPSAPQAAPSEPAPAPAVPPQEQSAAPVDTAPAASSGDEVHILGKEGFDREEVSVSAGGTIRFVNDDAKPMTLTFKGPSGNSASSLIKSGESYEKTFDMAGTYQFWTVAYGVRATLNVE